MSIPQIKIIEETTELNTWPPETIVHVVVPGLQGPAGPGGVWGDITGTLSDQADLQAALDAAAGGVWGDITGTLSDQADLQAALDAAAGGVWGSISGDIGIQVDLQMALAHKAAVDHTHDIDSIVSGMTWDDDLKNLNLSGDGAAAALMTLQPGTSLATKYALKVLNSDGDSFGILADGSIKATGISGLTSLSSEILDTDYLTVTDSVTGGRNNLLWIRTNATQSYQMPLRLDFTSGKTFKVDGTGKLTAPADADIIGLLTIDQSDQATGAYEALSIIGNDLFGDNGIKMGAIGAGPAIWFSDNTNLYWKGIGTHSLELSARVNSSSYISLRAMDSVKFVDSSNNTKLAFSFPDGELQLLAETSLGNDFPVGVLKASMSVNTEAAFTGLSQWLVADYSQTAGREAIRAEADGSQIKIGLYGTTAVAQADYLADAETSHSLDASYNQTQLQDALNALAVKINNLIASQVDIGRRAAA